MRVFIVWIKNLVKQLKFWSNIKFHEYFAGWPFSPNTHELDNLV